MIFPYASAVGTMCHAAKSIPLPKPGTPPSDVDGTRLRSAVARPEPVSPGAPRRVGGR
jgi:hypothetical protein